MYVKLDDVNIYYEAKGEDEPGLFIHGTPTSAFIWRKQADELSRYFQVYTFDLPGWRRSEKPKDFDYKLESYADIVHQFLKEVGIEKFTLVLHDLGAAVGLTFLARYPEIVSRLVILDTFAYMRPSKKLQWQMFYGLLGLPIIGSLLHRFVWLVTVEKTDFFVTLAFYDKKLATKDLVEKYRENHNITRIADYRTFLANRVSGIINAIEANASKVKVPTLILWAENDFLFPISAAKKLQKEIRGSILKTISLCGHFLQEEKPDEVNRCILEFLRV